MYKIYTVLGNDTLDKIAKEFDTTVLELNKINGFGSDYELVPGSQIVVPVLNKQPYQYYTVKKGDNLYEIAKNNGIDYNLLVQLNGLEKGDYIYPNQTIILPKDGLNIYMTKDNDTIEDVLTKLNITIDELMDENQKIYLREEQVILFREK